MSLEHKQHRPPSVKCPAVGEKGSRITNASSRSLKLERKTKNWQNNNMKLTKTYSKLKYQNTYTTDFEKGGFFPKYS